MMKLNNKMILLRVSLLALLCMCLSCVTSCGDDAPEGVTGYYLSIDSQVRLNLGSNDGNQGTASGEVVDVLSNTVRNMLAALKEAYPEDTHAGNDEAVLAACNLIYRNYKEAYADKEGQTVCVIKLVRVKKVNDVVAESTTLTTYHFGQLPTTSPF